MNRRDVIRMIGAITQEIAGSCRREQKVEALEDRDTFRDRRRLRSMQMQMQCGENEIQRTL